MMHPIDGDALATEASQLYRFARSLVRDDHLAADLTQDTLVRAMERSSQYRGDAPLGAWLRGILRNLSIDRARRSSRELPVEEVEDDWRDDAYTVDPSVVAERAATREELEDALVRLPFDYRVPVILHDVEGWKVREIAELEEISLPAAKQRLRRGRMMLVSALASGSERRAILKGVPMRCWEARRHVSDYLDGALNPQIASQVESHLERCPTCPPLYAALVGVSERLPGLRDPDSVVPPELEARLQDVTRLPPA